MSESALRPFHLALPVHDLGAARAFYGEVLACVTGRTSERWIDFDFFGHQLTVHLHEADGENPDGTNPVDGAQVPVRHFGVILSVEEWERLARRLRQRDEVSFIIAPTVRFAGETGEQRTMFFRDPSGNALEFKAFANDAQIFTTA